MTILWINLAIVFILSYFSRVLVPNLGTDEGNFTEKPNKLLVFGVMLCLVVISGLRKGIGDTYNYKQMFIKNDFTWDFIKTEKDIGFGIFQMILKQYSEDPQIMVFTAALFTNVLIIIVLYNYSRLFELSTYLYITGGIHLVSMNGIRQVLAAAIIFTATKYLLNGSFIKYALIVLLASTFHQSALLLLPIYFIVRIKAWTKYTFFILFSAILIVIGYNQFTQLLFSVLQDTQYNDYSKFNEGGANIIRVIVSAAPLVIAYIGREKLRAVFPKSDYIVNMALLGLVFMIISTQQWIFARVAIYFNLYQLILISWIIEVFSKKDRKFVYYMILVLYFIFYYYENVVSLNILYESDWLDNLFK